MFIETNAMTILVSIPIYILIGGLIYALSRYILRANAEMAWWDRFWIMIFFGIFWPLGIMFAATFLLMWIFTLPGDFYRKKPDIDTPAAVCLRLSASGITRKADRRKPQ
ncbi:hypothetical protein PS051_23765 (plasmid) [Escherichia albertii]|nr:hypothetical protein [Escherichia albertii]WDB90707.1 hypothetical protein PS051_23765 [Escherichia albertii]